MDPDRQIPPAPNLSELAGDSTSFTQAIANGPNTPSSFPTILTSTHPMLYGSYRYLDDQRPFLSRTLRDAGFDTVGYHSNPHLGPERNYNHGFDVFNDGEEDKDDASSMKNFVDDNVDPDSRLYKVLRRIWHYFTMATDTSAYEKAPSITDRATTWFNERRDEETPFFMWLHYMDVHYPFKPPERFREELGIDPLSSRRIVELNGKMQEDPDELTEEDVSDLLDLYDAEIRFTDHYIGKLLDDMESRGILDETCVIVTADHGEAFGEHGRFGHHSYLYDELLRVPLVISTPDVDGRTVNQQVSLVDIGPTVYELTGVERPNAVQGSSLVPLMRGETSSEDVALSTASGGDMLACRTSKWKCFWQVEPDVVELYDLQDDPGELRDVSDQHPEVVSRFVDRLESYREHAAATDTDVPEVNESEEVKQRLEDLGYVD